MKITEINSDKETAQIKTFHSYKEHNTESSLLPTNKQNLIKRIKNVELCLTYYADCKNIEREYYLWKTF